MDGQKIERIGKVVESDVMDGQSFDMQGHAPRCAERSGELAHKASHFGNYQNPVLKLYGHLCMLHV